MKQTFLDLSIRDTGIVCSTLLNFLGSKRIDRDRDRDRDREAHLNY